MANYTKHYKKRQRGATATRQTRPIAGREKDMVRNRAGGYSFSVDSWTQLDRFLILGSEGGTYYATEREMTVENAKNVVACINADGKRVIDRILEIAKEGRAPKYDAILFAYAMASKMGDEETRAYANARFTEVCNIGTHVFNSANNILSFGGFGSGTRRAFARWYNEMSPERLAYQLVKYQQRNGMSHADVLRMAHVKPQDTIHDMLYAYAAGKLTPVDLDEKTWAKTVVLNRSNKKSEKEVDRVGINNEAFNIIEGFERAKKASTEKEIISLIEKFNLPQECVPTQWRNKEKVASAILQRMPMTATLRGLGKNTAAGAIKPLSENEKLVVKRITNVEALKKAKVHPIHVLAALAVYENGRGVRGSLSWDPNRKIINALNDAFYASFKTFEPSGKRFYLGLDVSGSMGVPVNGMDFLDCRQACAAMALATDRIESNCYLGAFTAKGGSWTNTGMHHVDFDSRTKLEDALRKMDDIPMGMTDCSLPMLDALEKKLEVDAFVIYTDSESYAGRMQPVEALRKYRDKMGIDAKLICVAMAANRYSVADPKDAGMLDIVGLDSATPNLISSFAKGDF